MHFDYPYLSEGEEDQKQVHAVKNNFCGYCWLESSSSATSDRKAQISAP